MLAVQTRNLNTSYSQEATWQTIESLKQYQLTMFCITRLDHMTVFRILVRKILMSVVTATSSGQV